MDIVESTKKISSFLRKEILFFISTIALLLILYICDKIFPGGNWFSVWSIIGIYVFIGGIIVLILMALINLVRAIKIAQNVNHSIKNIPVEYTLLPKFKRNYHVILITNGFIICSLFIALFPGWFQHNIPIGRRSMNIESATSERNEAQERLSKEPEHIKWMLSRFKEIVSEYQISTFVGYGEVVNDGDCVNPKINSLFMIASGFKPKEIKDAKALQYLSIYNTDMPPILYANEMNRRNLNNLNDARCFSNQDHFAYQAPSYFEKEYPKFYCVDDIHPDVKINYKQIIGVNCEDIDSNYVPPAEKPIPDTEYYKDFLNITEADYR